MGATAKRISRYWKQPLGAYYRHPANRLLLYPFIFSFFLIECGTFWVFYQGVSFVVDYMAFTTVYTLHKALVYTVSIFVADLLANLWMSPWGAYEKRTVGRQWLIWSLGLAVGFVLQRTMVRSLIYVYAPEVIEYFVARPQMRLSAVTLLMALIPYWVVMVAATLQVILSRQRTLQVAESLQVLPAEHPVDGRPPADLRESIPAGLLSLGNGGGTGNGAIALADITHVTVEDHYCRICYASDAGPKSEMVRLPLKEMMRKLPPAHFLRIHRSHVVNVRHISKVARKGRDRRLVLHPHGEQLPVSRSRFKALSLHLKEAVPHN